MQSIFSHFEDEPEPNPSFASACLSSLPPEVIAPITDLLTPVDITRLWETGCRVLMKSMAFGGVQTFKLEYEISGDRRWPEIVSKFRKLRTLIITAPFGVGFSKVNLQGLAPTIRHLKFTFNEAESAWYLPPGRTVRQLAKEPFKADMMNVSELLPNLESLELAGAFHVSNHFVSTLPKSTTNISIQTIDDVRPPGTPTFFSQEGLDHLPPYLTKMSLHGYMTWTPEDVQKLPGDLEHLELVGTANLDNACLFALPRSLRHLGFSFSKKSTISDIGLFHLPSSLISLDLRNSEKLKASCFAVLPKGLTSLQVGGPDMFITPEDAKLLPRTILSLNLSNVGISNNNVFATIPRMLHKLIIVTRERSSLTDGCASLLPTSLTYLHISCPARGAPSWNDLFIERLRCRNLRTFQVSPHYRLTDACIPHLPRSLTDLDLGCANLMTEKALKGLPPNLTKLNIRDWDFLSTPSIALLPRNMDTLVLNRSYNVTDESFRVLPPALTHLELRTSTQLTDEAFQHLPPALRVLYLPGSFQLTGECTRHLPPSITSVRISDAQLLIHAMNQQCSQAIPKSPQSPGWFSRMVSWIGGGSAL